MKLEELKKGYIVRCGTKVLVIDEVTDEGIKTIAGSFSIKDVEPVEIGSKYDSRIKVKFIPRTPVLGPNDSIPICEWPYYLEYKLKDGRSIADIVRENNIAYVHELQKWFKDNDLNILISPYL